MSTRRTRASSAFLFLTTMSRRPGSGHQGRVFEKDVGPKTDRVAAAIDAYDPDATWTEVTE